jgi:hypothetical protein
MVARFQKISFHIIIATVGDVIIVENLIILEENIAPGVVKLEDNHLFIHYFYLTTVPLSSNNRLILYTI